MHADAAIKLLDGVAACSYKKKPCKLLMMDKNTFLFTLIFLLCFLVFSSALVKKSLETDESALLAFKSHITVDSNSTHLLSNWTQGTSVCSWIGVRCSPLHNRVAALNVSGLGLLGTIPPQFGNLSFLKSVDISNNRFQGQLPQKIAGTKLRRLVYIDLSVNGISGDIPPWFGSLPNLQHLNLRNNSFSGNLPVSLFNATKLEFLSLGSNQLNGLVPEEVGHLGNLRILDLQYNLIEGSLPPSFLNLSSLEVMALTGNRLSGELPLDICSKLPRIAEIDISYNQFSGNIQSRFRNCSELQFLSLSLNHFTGVIPREIGNLTQLVQVFLGYTQFQGDIPPELGNLHNLDTLSIGNTSISGQIPAEIGKLQRLLGLYLSMNNLSGPIPQSIYNISSLSEISLNFNNLIGTLPSDIGLHLPNLNKIGLANNILSGVVPDSISNLTELTELQLARNQFTGAIPASLSKLRSLQFLILFDNFLTIDSVHFLESLTSCTELIHINIGSNPIDIQLTPAIGNFSSSLENFFAQPSGIRGSIPSEIGNLSGLLGLALGDSLTSAPPPTIQKLSNLQYLDLGGNRISGFFPNYLCNMKQLIALYLWRNKFYGHIPECFGNMTSLVYLDLHSNELNSSLPIGIGNLRSLLELDLSSNLLSGNISSSIGGLNAAITIDLSDNKFSGIIPQSIGGLGNLINLSLAHNQLQGPIPETFKNLLSIKSLDLSHNNLSGEILAKLEKLPVLSYLNVSFNHFKGKVPATGSFMNLTRDSFMSNDALCGGPPQLNFPVCITDPHKKESQRKKLRTVAYILIPIATLVFLICATLFVLLRRRKKVATTPSQVELTFPFERVSYYEVQQATNDFNESNLLGAGSFGSVYKAVLRDGTILAVKVFNQQLERAIRSFETECEVISKIRHRNLLRVISCCSNLDFKALVLEYMPNGSLEKWLYSHNHFLDFLQRLNIMLDVASALVYMHHDYPSPIVHCDMKPSNVLLDEEMTGHVSDFGISKLLSGDENVVQTMTLATIGYTAPEYGSEGLVSTRCDVYSFGILLMETFTRRKPTDEMFEEGWGLREMIKDGLRNSEIEFIDENLMNIEDGSSNKLVKCVVLIMELALQCAMDSLEQRADVKDVLVELHKIKQLFLSNSA